MAAKQELPSVWVRDESSRIWGPLSLATLELMVDHGVVSKPFDYSVDGVDFQPAPDDLLAGGATMPAGLAPPVLASTSAAPSGSSAMKAAVRASRAEQSPRAPGGGSVSGGLPPKAGASLPSSGRAASPLPPRSGGAAVGVPPKPVAGPAPAEHAATAPHSPAGPPSVSRASGAPAPKAGAAPAGNSVPKASGGPPHAPAPNRVPRSTSSAPVIAPPPPPTGLRAIQAAPPQGRLEEISGLQLYYLIAAADAGGMLTLDEGSDEVRMWFKQGTPQAVQSSAQGLGPFLVEHRAISQGSLDEALGQSAEDPISFLFASGQLNPSAVFPLIQQHSLAILQRGLLIEKGPFAFDPEQPVPASGFPLGNRWEILLGAARRLDSLSLQRRLAGREEQAPGSLARPPS